MRVGNMLTPQLTINTKSALIKAQDTVKLALNIRTKMFK